MVKKSCNIKDDQKTILVLEDEKPLLFAISTKLKSKGYNVMESRSVEEASIFLKGDECIDAIWLDHYLLGKEDGIDFMSVLKESDFKNVPVFVVSNTVNPNKIRAYIMMGVVKYYTKAEHRLEEIIADINKSIS
jgi:CheY-like chemotaxis protein